MELLLHSTADILVFFVKLALIIMGILMVIAAATKSKDQESRLQIKNLNKKFADYKRTLLGRLLAKKDLKKELKSLQTVHKDLKKKPRLFVIDFKGDIRASEVDSLRELITALLTVSQAGDEVLLNVESPGGVVHGYGLAASQIQRLKTAGLKLTICVDKVAASGGYMMACLADQLIAAPFAIIGSVGVVAGIPNFHRVLKKNDVDYYQITSGKFKRTLSLLGEVTEEGIEKFKEEIHETHELFKQHVQKFRPQVNVEKIATGEHWYGQQALELSLVDALGTSDDFLFERQHSFQLVQLCYKEKKNFKDKIAENMVASLEKIYDFILSKLMSPKS